MKQLPLILATWLVLTGAAAAETLPASDQAALQAAMFSHIERQLVDGSLLQMNLAEGKVVPLFPAKTHPKIMRMGDHFVLCVDFRDRNGKDVNVDFFVAREGVNFVVFHTEIDNRAGLKNLIKSGRVVAVN